ncbi:hypothetical protein HYPSUDRAFT_150974, partial [Hypholoma sublateritium FD-334 SS-4]
MTDCIRRLDRSFGRVQILSGRVYYSPNSSRVVQEPAVDRFGENPFRNAMDLDISNYMNPRWWSRAWGWISWLMLDRDLTTITSLIQVYFDIPVIRPMNPRAFGFHNRFRHPWMVAKVITKSRDWFSVWVALLSFLIARAEDKQREVQHFPNLAKKSWYDFLLEKGVERTWLDSLAIEREKCPPSWKEFFASREALNKRLEITETASDKQKRLSREKKPPTQSAKVFRWVKDHTSERYIREQVSKKWRQDTLGDYSSNQIRYDSFSNEYDCSSQFGSDDESDGEE